MNGPSLIPGRIVLSLAGRDRGRKFVVIEEVDQDFVLIADGGLRGIERLKKKRRKHLKPLVSKMVLPEGRLPMDYEIRSALGSDL